MNRRFSLGTLAVVALVVLAGCAAPLQSNNGDAQSGDTANEAIQQTISTSGTGEASADADRAIVSVAVTARAETTGEARESVAANATEMRDALGDAGIADDAVTTAYYRIQPITEVDRESDDRRVVGYEAVHAFRIEVDADTAGTVVDTAVKNGASDVQSVQFTLSDETRAELREEALERAMSAARADADVIAASADLSVTGVHSASTSGRFEPVYHSRETAGDAGGGIATEFDAGSVTVTATVDVTYTAAA